MERKWSVEISKTVVVKVQGNASFFIMHTGEEIGVLAIASLLPFANAVFFPPIVIRSTKWYGAWIIRI